MKKKDTHIKIYHGYGYRGNLQVYGHVFLHAPPRLLPGRKNSFWANIRQLWTLFSVRTRAFMRVSLEFQGVQYESKTQFDGFFHFQWTPEEPPAPGWHTLTVRALDEDKQIRAQAQGKVFVIRQSRYAFISDVDDTVIKSYSSTVIRRVYELLSRNLLHRKTFDGVIEFYNRLTEVHTETYPNPFFYVSSSEWNLYEYLKALFRHQGLPEGIFLLNPIKNLGQVLKTGRTGHEGKHARILRILAVLPDQKMVLIGDNSQRDPFIYARIAGQYPERVQAIFIRNVRASKAEATRAHLEPLQDRGIPYLLFDHSDQALAFAATVLAPGP